jgi:hypothetical protein
VRTAGRRLPLPRLDLRCQWRGDPRSGAHESHARDFDEADDLGGKLLERLIAAHQLGARELVLQILHESFRIVAERIAQTPFSLAATKMEPNEHSPIANLISALAPSDLKSVGAMTGLATTGVETTV